MPRPNVDWPKIIFLSGVALLAGWIFFDSHGTAVTSEVVFNQPFTPKSGIRFGPRDQFVFETFRGGTFESYPEQGFAHQKSESYRDSAWIRPAKSLPPMYHLTAVVGHIDYDLEPIQRLRQDPEYKEGPRDENGVYLLVVTDALPTGHHTNDWWQKHRKIAIYVNNNVWGSGMPNPIFMIYQDPKNEMVSFDGARNEWSGEWRKAWEYRREDWFRVEVIKTSAEYILRLSTEQGVLLKEARVPHAYVWHEDGRHPEYFVIGDPHENYYQGSLKIKSIRMEAGS